MVITKQPQIGGEGTVRDGVVKSALLMKFS
jgi:hypothetical protein